MKKSKLIEILNSIEGDPDILLWNGLAQDWMDIDKTLVPSTLTKLSFDSYVKMTRVEDGSPVAYQPNAEELATLRKDYRKYNHWDYDQFVTEKDVDSGGWLVKNVIFINAKVRKKDSFGRTNLSY